LKNLFAFTVLHVDVPVFLGLQPRLKFKLSSFEVMSSFLSKIYHQKLSSFILVIKYIYNKASKYTDELTVRRRGLDGAISFKWTYHGENIGLVPKQ